MKIIHRDLRHGVIKVAIESLDDLWYLSNVIQPGDVVKSKTERRIKGKDDIERGGKSERVTITIAARVEKAEFKTENDTFRINGVIEEGPEDLVSIGSYHTIAVELDSVLTIIKDGWTDFEIERLKEAERSTLRPKLLIAIVDDGEANIGLVRESKIEYLDLNRNVGGKYDTKGREDRKKEFYGELAALIENMLRKDNVSAVILGGTGFEKENFHRFLSEKNADLCRKCVVENTGSHGRAAISEVMKRGETKKVEEEIASARDIRMMNKLLEEIGKDSGLAAYGRKDVENAAQSGAVELMIVTDELFMKNRLGIDRLMRDVKGSRGNVHMVNSEGEAGKQLTSLGGIAGILRYRIG